MNGELDGSDCGSVFCSEEENWVAEAYNEYATRAGPESRNTPLMLGHCAPPSWMVDADMAPDMSEMFLEEIGFKCYGRYGLYAEDVPLLQLNNHRGGDNLDYLVFTAKKADLLARNFSRVRAYVQVAEMVSLLR